MMEKSRHKTAFVFVVIFYIFQLELSESVCTYKCECFEHEMNQFNIKCNDLSEFKTSDILCCISRNDSSDNFLNEESVFEIDISNNNLTKPFDFGLLTNFTNLQVLNLSRSNLTAVDWGPVKLANLEVLDLSYNKLENISEEFFVLNKNLKIIGLQGNKWHYEILSWFIDWAKDAVQRGVEILDKENFEHFIYNKSQNIWALVESCPKNCSCYSIPDHGTMLRLNCNGRGLTDFPEQIPYNTRILHFENNKIMNFSRFTTLQFYSMVTGAYLDNNLITSIAGLEGTQRKYRLSTLYLNGNKLTHLPTHEMRGYTLKLGGNPWQCDCNSGTELRNFLVDRFRHIHDINNVTCDPNGSKNANRKVLDLTQIDLCYVEVDQFHYLDVVNVILGTLIIIVLAKLCYDWWHFKHTGQLPMGPIAIVQLWNKKRFRFFNTPD